MKRWIRILCWMAVGIGFAGLRHLPVGFSRGQSLPDTPQPQTTSFSNVSRERETWTREHRVETISHVSLAAFDAAQTCVHLSESRPGYWSNPIYLPNGNWHMTVWHPPYRWHEDYLPSQNCAAIAGMIGAQTILEELIAYKLERHHQRLAHLVRMFGITDSAEAIVYSFAHH